MCSQEKEENKYTHFSPLLSCFDTQSAGNLYGLEDGQDRSSSVVNMGVTDVEAQRPRWMLVELRSFGASELRKKVANDLRSSRLIGSADRMRSTRSTGPSPSSHART